MSLERFRSETRQNKFWTVFERTCDPRSTQCTIVERSRGNKRKWILIVEWEDKVDTVGRNGGLI